MDFSDWLLQQMSGHGWSQSDLSRLSGLTRQSISDYVNRRRTNPDTEALIAIAKALNISPISVFRKAGLLPPTETSQTNLDDWEYLLQQLPPEDQEEIRQIALIKIERRQKTEAAEHANKFKRGKQNE